MNMEAESFPQEYRETFQVLQGQIREYLAGDRSYLFDSVELHIIQTYYYGARTGLDGSTIYGNFELVKNMAENALPTVEWLAEKGIKWQATVSEPVGAMVAGAAIRPPCPRAGNTPSNWARSSWTRQLLSAPDRGQIPHH